MTSRLWSLSVARTVLWGRSLKKWLLSEIGFRYGISCKHSDFYISLPLPRKKSQLRFGVLEAVNINNTELWDVTPVLFRRNVSIFGRQTLRLIDMQKKNSIYIAYARLAKFWSRKMGVSQYICSWWMMHVEIVGSRKVDHRNLSILQDKCNVIQYLPIVTVTRTFNSTSWNFCITTKVMYLQTWYWGAFA
jgi:hypothetical protein